MNTDSQLLCRYHEEHSEPAFTELVQRHVGLVYSVALRRVGGDAQLAQDVAQKVFCDLARKAPTLAGRPTLGGWLYASAHLASAAIVRGEQRRKARETEAHFMQTTLADPESDADLNAIRPLLDEVIVSLKDQEREVLALRFFEQRSLVDVGSSLKITEEAARKRVDRALDKLRSLLGRRGVISTAAALGTTLTAMSNVPAPSGVAANVANYTFAQAGVQSAAPVLTTMIKTSWPAAAALIVGGFLLNSQRHTNEELQGDLARLTAENQQIAAMRTDNRQLALHLAQTETSAPSPRSTESPAKPAASSLLPLPTYNAVISVSPQGSLMWNQDRVTVEEFIQRLRQETTSNPKSRINLRDAGAKPTQLAWVVDEVRKAQIENLVIDSDAPPVPR